MLLGDRPLRVGILGVRWGRTHVGTFRAAGCEVVALVADDPDRGREAAREEGVLGADVASLEAADVVVVATPIETHLALVERWAHKAVFCEKPFAGPYASDARADALATPTLGAAYALAFVDEAQEARRRVQGGALGALLRAEVRVAVRLEDAAPTRSKLVEVGVHPLSYLHVLLGPLATRRVEAQHGAIHASIDAVAVGAEVDVALAPSATPGISLEVVLRGEGGALALEGAWGPGGVWQYALRLPDGSVARRSLAERDPWFSANARAVASWVERVRGGLSDEEARARGLFDGARALAFERGILPLWGAP